MRSPVFLRGGEARLLLSAALKAALNAGIHLAAAVALTSPAAADTVYLDGRNGEAAYLLAPGIYELDVFEGFNNRLGQYDPGAGFGWYSSYRATGPTLGTFFGGVAGPSPSAVAAGDAAPAQQMFVPDEQAVRFFVDDSVPADNVGRLGFSIWDVTPDFLRFRLAVENALGISQCRDQPNVIDKADCATAEILKKRGKNSLDPALRDAEYWLRNYKGGLRLRELLDVGEDWSDNPELVDIIDDLVRSTPASTIGYIVAKTYAKRIGYDLEADPGAPTSEAGGSDAAWDGWLSGFNREPLEEAYRAFDPAVLEAEDFILPAINGPVGDTINLFLGTFLEGLLYAFDPLTQVEYRYLVETGSGITAVEPIWDGLGPDAFLFVGLPNGENRVVSSGYNIVPQDFGIDVFTDFNVMVGTGTGEQIDYLLGLTFADSGSTAISREVIPPFGPPQTAVPGPAPAGLLALALGVLLAAARRRGVRAG